MRAFLYLEFKERTIESDRQAELRSCALGISAVVAVRCRECRRGHDGRKPAGLYLTILLNS